MDDFLFYVFTVGLVATLSIQLGVFVSLMAPTRFSLRGLLTVTTLVAVALGVIVTVL